MLALPVRAATYELIPMTDGPTSTTAQLKADINTGKTGDQVAASNIALSNLGTDDEAGGTPPSPEAIKMARDFETSQSAVTATKPRSLAPWVMAAVLLALTVAVVAMVVAL